MPTYEYRCEACEHEFEKFQSMKDNPIKKCPECGKQKVKRVIGSGAGILFKGSGFYQTDYRSKSYSDGASKDSSSKPAAKSDSAGTSKSCGKGECK